MIEFKFCLWSTVKIKSLGMDGTIDAIQMNTNGIEYRIIYWWNGIRYSQWMYEIELDEK